MGIFRKQTTRAPLTTVLLVLLLALSIAASSIGFAAWTGAKKQFVEIDSQYTTIAILSGANYEKLLFGDRATFIGLDSLKFSDGTYYIGPQSAKLTAQQSPYFVSAESNILLSAHVAGSTAITSGTVDILNYNAELDNHCYSLGVFAAKYVGTRTINQSAYLDTVTYIAIFEIIDNVTLMDTYDLPPYSDKLYVTSELYDRDGEFPFEEGKTYLLRGRYSDYPIGPTNVLVTDENGDQHWEHGHKRLDDLDEEGGRSLLMEGDGNLITSSISNLGVTTGVQNFNTEKMQYPDSDLCYWTTPENCWPYYAEYEGDWRDYLETDDGQVWKEEIIPNFEMNHASATVILTDNLGTMVDCKTVWQKDGENAGEYQRFYRIVAESFPKLHSRAQRLSFGDGCFFYVIEGKNPQKNILLMAHHDVVDGGEGWDTDPFCAAVKDGALWGRGTVDTKTPLFAELLAEGYDFEGMNFYIGSSHNEEVSGDGMVLAAEYFRQHGIRFDVILDEGGAITQGLIPGVSAKSAVVAVHEKGRHLYRCTVRESSEGHGGLNPTTGSPVATLSEFVTRVSKSKIFKASFAPEVKATFTRHAPYMAFPLNLVFGNFSLFSPIIKKIMAKIPQASAMISTGFTFTSFHAGNGDNPQMKAKEAEVCLFLRCVREEDLKEEMAAVRKIADEYGIEIQEVLRDYCRPTSFSDRPFRVLEQILHENFPDVIVAPFLLTAGTDARRFTDIADSILRFAPIDLNKQQFSSIHGKNENITIQNIGQCVLFYKDFIKQI